MSFSLSNRRFSEAFFTNLRKVLPSFEVGNKVAYFSTEHETTLERHILQLNSTDVQEPS